MTEKTISSSESAVSVRLWAAVFAGLLSGFVLIQSLSLADSKPVFLLALPAALAVVLMMMFSLRGVLAAILLSRALLDPLLEGTKVSLGGQAAGLGALINLFVIAVAFGLILQRPREAVRNGIHRRWLVFLAFCFVAVLHSPVPGKAVKNFFDLLSYLGMSLIPMFLVRDEKDKRFWIKLLLVSSILPVAFGYLDFAHGGTYYADAGWRVKGTFSHPNILGFYLVFMIALTFYALRSPDLGIGSGWRKTLGAYLLVLAGLLVLTKTRNAWISCWLFFFLYGLFKDRKILLLSVLLPPLFLASPIVRHRIQDLTQGTGGDVEDNLNSFAWRMELWKRALGYGRSHLIVGYGLSSFQPLSLNFFEAPKDGAPAHNTYVQVLFETGIFGLLAYLSLYFGVIKTLYRKMKRSAPRFSSGYAVVLAYAVCYMISCAGDNMLDYLAFNWYFWFFLGVVVRSAALQNEKSLLHHTLV